MTPVIASMLQKRFGEDVCLWVYHRRELRPASAKLAAQGVLLSHDSQPSDEAKLETARVLLITDELRRLAAALDDAGVGFMPIKGPSLSMLLYESPARRGFTDLDVMVRPSDAPKAIRALDAAGYRGHATDYARGIVHEVRSPRGVSIEIHYALSVSERFSRLHAALWEQPREISIATRRYQIPNVEGYLLYLCVHLARHLTWPRLLWIEDIRQYVERHPLVDWERFCDLAQRSQSATSAWVAARTLRMFLALFSVPGPVPQWVEARLEATRSSPTRILVPRVTEALLRRPTPLRHRAYSLALSESLTDRAYLALSFAKRRIHV